MKKFLTIVNAFWQRALTYRFTVLAYRIGEMVEILVLILMWTAIYGEEHAIKGFTLKEMITYILIGNLFHTMIRNFLANLVASDIKDGRLSMFLIKPIGYFGYILSREIGRISLTTIMSALSQLLIILFFFNSFIWNFEAAPLLLILIIVILAFINELLLAYLIGLIAFWTDEVDGMYSTIERVKKFFSGGYFPLNLLPQVFINVSSFLPFAYSFYIPSQIYLKKVDLSVGIKGIAVQLLWIFLLFILIKIVWARGLRKYEGVGI